MTVSSNQKAIRFENIDLLKGITILLVVLYHLTFFYKDSQFIRIYSTPFFMQLFFFVSGMFFSPKSDFKTFFKNKINRVFIPLLFFYFLNYFAGFLASLALSKTSGSSVDPFALINLLDLFNGKEYFTYSGALWFLVCLLNVSFIFYIISKIKNEYFKLTIVLLFSCLGYYLGSNQINIPYFLDSAFTSTTFFNFYPVLLFFKV